VCYSDKPNPGQNTGDQQHRRSVGEPFSHEAEQRGGDHDPRRQPPQQDVPAVGELIHQEKRDRTEAGGERRKQPRDEHEDNVLDGDHIGPTPLGPIKIVTNLICFG